MVAADVAKIQAAMAACAAIEINLHIPIYREGLYGPSLTNCCQRFEERFCRSMASDKMVLIVPRELDTLPVSG